MNFKNNLVIAGCLLVAVTMLIISVQSSPVREDNEHGIKKHVDDELKRNFRRQADDESAESDGKSMTRTSKKPKQRKKSQESNKTSKPSALPKPPNAESDATEKPDSKKRDSVVKNDENPTKSRKSKHGSTLKPGKRSSTSSPSTDQGASSDTPTKSKDESKDDKSSDEEVEKPGNESKESNTRARTLFQPSRQRQYVKDRSRMKALNDRWLQNQEVVAIEHMIAGAYDWIKVLTQTDGKVLNRVTAGELFDKFNNKLVKMLREEDRPEKLIAYYEVYKTKGI